MTIEPFPGVVPRDLSYAQIQEELATFKGGTMPRLKESFDFIEKFMASCSGTGEFMRLWTMPATAGRSNHAIRRHIHHAHIVRMSIGMKAWLVHKRFDAVLSPNDRTARHIMEWFDVIAKNAAVEPLRLLSFDDELRFQQIPMASIDFGYTVLGYKAFHAIMKDMPVGADSTGAIAGVPTVHDRGIFG